MSKPILVVKFGTASITQSNGEPNLSVIAEIARQVSVLHASHHVILVSSGAVGAGKSLILHYKGSLTQRKAAAAIGNPLLIGHYADAFRPFGIAIAQSLCERQHFASRTHFLQLKHTFEELWQSGVIPVVNENDVVSDRELRFSDNDELATLLAAGFGASALLICTSVGGLLDEAGNVVPEVEDVNTAFRLVRDEKSALGLGGMVSKLTFAKLATRMGIQVIIFGMGTPDGLLAALEGKAGTRFLPQKSTLTARNRWLGSGGRAAGRLRIDAGAAKALRARKSLLAVGVTDVIGDFEAGEIIDIYDLDDQPVAVARTRENARYITENLRKQNFEVAHANDIVLL